MVDFAIIDPKAGIGESMPTITLPEALLAKESRNIRFRHGRYDRIPGRLAVLEDSEGVKIAAPTDIYAVVTASGSTIVVTGDVLSGNTALADGATIRLNGNDTAANNITYTVSGTPVYGGANSTITIAETIDTADNSGNVFVGSTPIINHHRHVTKGSQTEYLLLGTKYHILLWSNTAKSLTVKWTNTDPDSVLRWEIEDHLRNVVATNNSDFVLWWNVDGSPSNNFAALDNADGINYEGTSKRLTKCKHIASYEGYLVLGYTTEDGDVYPQRMRWASLNTGGTTIDFDQNGSGDAGAKDFTTTPGTLMGFARHGDDIVIAKSDTMHRAWLVTADTVFEWQEYTLKVGCLSADSLVNDKAGRLYWLASDLTIREINSIRPISTAIDVSIKNLNTSVSEYIQGTYVDEYDEIWFAFALGNSLTNDIIAALHPDSGRAFLHDIPVRSFGDYTQQDSYTYGTLPFSSYTEWGLDWKRYNTNKNFAGFPLDLGSDYNGNTFALHRASLDDGSDFYATLIISTTVTSPKSLNLFKRINNGATFLFNRKSAGSVEISAKEDTAKSWTVLGSVSLADDDEPESVDPHLPFDLRAKTFQFKLYTAGDMEYIGTIFTEIEIDGYR